jgi:hypothetical protein
VPVRRRESQDVSRSSITAQSRLRATDSQPFLELLLAYGARGAVATAAFLEALALGATVAFLQAFVLGVRVSELFALGARSAATTVAFFKLLLTNRTRGAVAVVTADGFPMAITTPSQETTKKYAQTTRILVSTAERYSNAIRTFY